MGENTTSTADWLLGAAIAAEEEAGCETDGSPHHERMLADVEFFLGNAVIFEELDREPTKAEIMATL